MNCATCGLNLFNEPAFTLIEHNDLDEGERKLYFCKKKCVKIYAVRKL